MEWHLLNVFVNEFAVIWPPRNFKPGSHSVLPSVLFMLRFFINRHHKTVSRLPRFIEIWKLVFQITIIVGALDVKNHMLDMSLSAMVSVWIQSYRLWLGLRSKPHFLSRDRFIISTLELLLLSAHLKGIIIFHKLFWGSQVCNSFLNCDLRRIIVVIILKLRFGSWWHFHLFRLRFLTRNVLKYLWATQKATVWRSDVVQLIRNLSSH